MNEIEKIQKQKSSLMDARIYLLHQTPSDMIAIAEVTERIIALEKRQSALIGTTGIPVLTNEQIGNLQSAIDDLDAQIKASKAASDILVAATAVAKSA
jgi:hypothetical protein